MKDEPDIGSSCHRVAFLTLFAEPLGNVHQKLGLLFEFFMVENLSNMDLFVTWEARIIAKVAKLQKIYYYLYKAEWL